MAHRRFRALLLIWAASIAGPTFAADEIHWSFTGPTSVTFDWRGPEQTIRYGLTTAYGQTETAATPNPLPFSSSGPFWEAKLTGLQENTVYHYSIGNGPDHTFRTPPPRGASGFMIYFEADLGDIGSYPTVGPVQSLIASDLPLFTLVGGDLTYGDDHGQSSVDQHFNDVMVWSQDAAYMPTWGNHEWNDATENLKNYKGRFDFPNPQSSPGVLSQDCPECGEDWYWFDYGNVRFIAYPEPYASATWSDWNTKARALMDEAQADPAIQFIVTFGHRPAYSSGYHSGNSTLKGYLDGLGDTHSKYVLNLNGHSHNYERSDPAQTHGVIHVTAGTGGASLGAMSSTIPSWSVFRAGHMGPLRLRFTSTGIEVAFICGPSTSRDTITCTQGSVVDSFTIGGVPVVDRIPPAAITDLR